VWSRFVTAKRCGAPAVSPLNDPLWRRFFGAPDEDNQDTPAPRGRGGRRAPREQKEEALGSGVIISADGYILSNNTSSMARMN